MTDNPTVPHRAPLARCCPAVLAILLAAAWGPAPAAAVATPAYEYGEMVSYPLVFPVDGDATTGSRSHFWDSRYSGTHEAQDIMAEKMTPVYAVASGTVTWIGSTCCTITITHDDGWESHYIHLNNDTPGTDDGAGWGIAPGVERWSRVERGQLIGWVGDSGNAEGTSPHLHFELKAPGDVAVDGFESLREAEAARGFACGSERATRVDTNGDHLIAGTLFDDVIVGGDEADTIQGRAGDDLICGGGGDDLLGGGPGEDDLRGMEGSDRLAGHGGDDTLFGGAGDDRLHGGEGADLLSGREGQDHLGGGGGDDLLLGGPGRDLLLASDGEDALDGGGGSDMVSFAAAIAAVAVDLAAGTASGWGAAALASIEVVFGSAFDDTITGDDGRNGLRGLAGDDLLLGAGGDDRIFGGGGDDSLAGGAGNDRLVGGGGTADAADGGEGDDACEAEATTACEA